MPRTTSAESSPLASYWAKRDFTKTPEPRGTKARRSKQLVFVIQKHDASRLHYDFRLEIDGVMVSWAVPKGPSYDPADKRLAVHVEDHPISYNSFEGTIPKGHYGAGTVLIWDKGNWEPVGDPAEGMAKGKLVFHMHGQKMAGLWELVRTSRGDQRQEQWLLFKKRDEFARPRSEYDVVMALPDSVIAKPLTPPAAASANSLEASPAKGSSRTTKTSGRLGLPGLEGAVKAALPGTLSPQLATLADGVPAAGTWLYEIKFDGYRLLAKLDKGKARLLTRNGNDWTEKMPALAKDCERLGIKSGWLDGEIVVLDDAGLPSFNLLQKAFDAHRSTDIVFFLFDVPFLEGYDLRGVELQHRRALLKSVVDGAEKAGSIERIRFSDDFDAAPATILTSACNMNLEGVIAKRADAPYVSTRSDTWLKLKCKRRQEFVVCGYTDRTDGSPQIGSLLLGVHDDAGQLISVGSVGTGWDSAEAADLKKKLARIETPAAPFAAGPAKKGRWSRRAAGSERWVQPKLVAEVSFAEWTPDGQIRHASYVSLRTDKPAKAIVRETAKAVDAGVPMRRVAAKGTSAGDIKVTHGERVIDASTGLTKLDLVRYYESVAEWILPHFKGRPVSLVRGPSGVGGQLFFQKHGEKIGIPGIKELDPALWPGHTALLEIATAKALTGAAQMNVIELHTWNSTTRRIDQPDRMVFDLDPGEGVAWPQVQEAAVLVHTLLEELQLRAWLKTSGGKGLHVVVPLTPQLDYDVVKDFSKAIVQHLAATIPSRFVAKSGPSNRVGKIFVDYLRNGHGATTATAFSARARPGLGVSMPIAWEVLPTLKSSAQWTIADAREHLSFQKVDPWADYWKHKQTLKRAMDLLGFKPA